MDQQIIVVQGARNIGPRRHVGGDLPDIYLHPPSYEKRENTERIFLPRPHPPAELPARSTLHEPDIPTRLDKMPQIKLFRPLRYESSSNKQIAAEVANSIA